ncbi:uncharacterized protein N0V89_005426 [Didymosphaeria variabile]|uniref:Uncharacterized protein n=1 Tax=Didymosphaeria variabile TaxID=1932322 RepID=A0A9W8XLB3_9PLEO|nr:uncharacterized protein N0V89_005426 [Didymosphaeria variabile]KAJ4353696.1 hypothetical protein N0V89_005426 [Didymosphaeria variabile]
MDRLKEKASRTSKGKEKAEEPPEKKLEPVQPTVGPNLFTVHHDHPRTANTRVAPWEALGQKPPPVDQPPKLLKKKSSIFSLRKEKLDQEEVVTSHKSAPPVPPIPFKYSLFPKCKQKGPFDNPPTPPFAKQRPDTGRSGSGSRAVPHVPQLTVPRKFVPLMTPYSDEGGLPKTPSKVTFAPVTTSSTSNTSSASNVREPGSAPQSPSERILTAIRTAADTVTKNATETTAPTSPIKRSSSTASSASNVLQHKFVPRSPSEETLTPPKRPKGTTFGVPNEVWEARYADHPEIVRFKEHIHNDGPPIEEMVYSPGIPASEYHRLKANFEATGSPFESAKAKGKKAKSLPQSSSSHSFATVTPFSYHQHEVNHSGPLEPPSRFYANRAAASSTKTLKSLFKPSSAATSPTYPEFAPLSQIGVLQAQPNRKSSSSSSRPASKESRIASTSSSSGSRFSVGTYSLGRSSRGKLKPKKSMRDLFKRSSSSGSPEQPRAYHISRPVLVPQPGPDSDVPPLPTTVKFTKPPGPPPTRPPRPDEEVDRELVAMRGSGITRMGFEGNKRVPQVDMGIRTPSGVAYERYSQERYTVKRMGRGMLIRDSMTGTKEFVEDI